jgi:hypothetical protein
MPTTTPGAGGDRDARLTPRSPGAPASSDDEIRRGLSGVEPGDGSLLDRVDAKPQDRPDVRAPRAGERE